MFVFPVLSSPVYLLAFPLSLSSCGDLDCAGLICLHGFACCCFLFCCYCCCFVCVLFVVVVVVVVVVLGGWKHRGFVVWVCTYVIL